MGKLETVAQYVENKLQGMSWRYLDDDMLRDVTQAVADEFNEPALITLFPTNSSKTPCNQRQISLIAALLGLEREELSELSDFAINEQEGKGTWDRKKQIFLRGEQGKTPISYSEMRGVVREIVDTVRQQRRETQTSTRMKPARTKAIIDTQKPEKKELKCTDIVKKIEVDRKVEADPKVYTEDEIRKLQERLIERGRILKPKLVGAQKPGSEESNKNWLEQELQAMREAIKEKDRVTRINKNDDEITR